MTQQPNIVREPVANCYCRACRLARGDLRRKADAPPPEKPAPAVPYPATGDN